MGGGSSSPALEYEVALVHSGMGSGYHKEWLGLPVRLRTLAQIREEVAGHTLTHLKVDGKRPPDLHKLTPDLLALMLLGVPPEDVNTFIGSTLLTSRYRLSKLSKLQKLYLSFNDLSTTGLPDIFSTLPKLRMLNVKWCGLIELPPSLAKLKQLTTLNVSANDFSSYGLPKLICSITSLTDLNLARCELKVLPACFSQLKSLSQLNISQNYFSSTGFPEVITSLFSLQKLSMRECGLHDLPPSFCQLERLEKLVMSYNRFVHLPSSISSLKNLKKLDISGNYKLVYLDAGIANLHELEMLMLVGCCSLISPPMELCRQGLPGIRQYYTDLAAGVCDTAPFGTVAVIGQKLAGKTSLIRTLQSKERQRVLTNRSAESSTDEATKVFNMEEVELENTTLRFVDVGGHEIYHLTYQLTLKENCIPVLVVNMETYSALSANVDVGEREAVRTLFLDWMSHLYLSCPDLGPPILVLTHKDKFTKSEFDTMKSKFLDTVESLWVTLVFEEQQLGGDSLSQIKQLADSAVFNSSDIYEVGGDEDYEIFDKIKNSLGVICKKFVKPIPVTWEIINKRMQTLDGCLKSFEDILERLHTSYDIERQQLEIVLTYMHDCGKLLWFKNSEPLQSFVFHKISYVTTLLAVIFHHDASRIWKERLQNFVPFLTLANERIEMEHYERMVWQFKDTGAMNKNLLIHLLRTESCFSSDSQVEAALALLQTFRLLHGPLKLLGEPSYIIPYFATGYQDQTLDHGAETVNFRVEILSKGLSLPRYVYHQMTVGLLELFTDETDTPVVKRNGATVFHGRFCVRLVHDFNSRKAVLILSSDAENIVDLWTQLMDVTNNTIKHILKVWRASRLVCVFYCPHCLLKGNLHPHKTVNPPWCALSTSHASPSSYALHRGVDPVVCGSDRDVPKPLKFPCQELSERDQKTVQKYVEENKVEVELATKEMSDAGLNRVDTPLGPAPDNDVSILHTPVKKVEEREPVERSVPLKYDGEEEGSDLSDGDGYIYPSDEYKIDIRMRSRPVVRRKVKELFSNTDKVYKMSAPIRGRALVINNKNFDMRPDCCRHGSEVDVKNLVGLLKDLKYEVKVISDVTAEEMLTSIQEETCHPDHSDYGMFVLSLMSHGTERDCLYGSDMKAVELKAIYDLLSPQAFPLMMGKPKLLIVQACSGDRKDFGNQGIHLPQAGMQPVLHRAEVSSETETQFPTEGRIAQLNVDDLLIIKSSFESYLAVRHRVWVPLYQMSGDNLLQTRLSSRPVDSL